MTKLKFTISLSNTADLIITDTTGYTSAIILDGFNAPGVTDATNFNLTDGYFLNAIIYNKYNDNPVLLNPDENLSQVVTPTVSYDANFSKMSYNLSQDGVFSIKRYFIISEEYFNANTFESGAVIYYSNGLSIYKSIDGEVTLLSKAAFVNEADTTFNGLVTTVKFVSTFYINQCYFSLVNRILDEQIIPLHPCDLDKSLLTARDLLYMTLEVIKNHKKLGNVVQIQKIIETLNACGTICKDILPLDCGCNG